MGIHKRLIRAIKKADTRDPKRLAETLIKQGWRDTEKHPKVQHVTVVPSLSPLMQTPLTQLRDHRSMPVDHAKTRYLE